MSITRRKFCYLVVLNEKFLTQLAPDLFLQIEQVLRLIGITHVSFEKFPHDLGWDNYNKKAA
ncbi:hypothetical protein B1L02_06380 [Pseudoalteromonas piscicida]|uniref:Uncharacterized protein n=1 Tax=Pseudoalteromonas piscicida TaxID=43662 RepID=A0AAD0RQ53_PSEO7|nr:hypothetical protein B1L02_06380 [Pseudoalteromonas piscicida]AXR02603.1 hypothetical protein D0511_11390 [Pseudoalteromonas piscicida]